MGPLKSDYNWWMTIINYYIVNILSWYHCITAIDKLEFEAIAIDQLRFRERRLVVLPTIEFA